MDHGLDTLLYHLPRVVSLKSGGEVDSHTFVNTLKVLDYLYETKQTFTTAVLFEFVLACHNPEHSLNRSRALLRLWTQGSRIQPRHIIEFLCTNGWIIASDKNGRLQIADEVRRTVCALASVSNAGEVHLRPITEVIDCQPSMMEEDPDAH